MRDDTTDDFGRTLTAQWREFDGTKLEFMKQIPGVTLDIRAEKLPPRAALRLNRKVYFGKDLIKELPAEPERMYYYCTVIRMGILFEVFSYNDDDWHCKY